MEVKNLSNTSLEVIVECLLSAFEGYFVKMPEDVEYYRNRFRSAKVDYSLSFGMFDGDKLIGFIIHAIDTRNGSLTAYNTGTGVIPKYRGKGVTKMIYKVALDRLIANGFRRSTLEVITKNQAAINAYKSIGFEITRTYKCFGGELSFNERLPFELKEVASSVVNWNEIPNQNYYSWDNQNKSIVEGNFRCFYVYWNARVVGFFILNEALNYIAQLELISNNQEDWKRIFSAIGSVSTTVRINNVDSRLDNKLAQLEQSGLKNTIDQYEMELVL